LTLVFFDQSANSQITSLLRITTPGKYCSSTRIIHIFCIMLWHIVLLVILRNYIFKLLSSWV